MNKTDEICRMLAKIQANLFEKYGDYSKCSPLVFIRRFMNSDLAKRFDNLLVLLETSSVSSMVEELDNQYGKTTFGDPDKYGREPLFWVGYLLRVWCYTYHVSSKVLISKIDLKKIVESYYIYHSFDISYAIEKIIEEQGIDFKKPKSILELLEEFKKDCDEK